MLIYWALFLIPAMAAASPYRLDKASRRLMMILTGIILFVLIGFRDHVGHDWNNYLRIFERIRGMDLIQVLLEPEPGYTLLNYLAILMGWDVHAVNAACALIFVIGLIAFCRRQPNFWLTLCLAMPVLIIGVSMAGTRQATAIGFLMLAFVAFQDRKLFRFIAFIIAGVLFHRSVAAFLLFAFFFDGRLRLWPLVIAGLAFFVLGVFVLRDAVSYYQESYVDTDIVATGALPRIALSVLAAVIFLIYRKRWSAWFDDGALFTLSALTICVMTLGSFNALPATDRMMMYLLPVQVAIFARLPLFMRTPQSRRQVAVGVFALYTAVLFVWLNFSDFAQASWVPYGNILWSQ